MSTFATARPGPAPSGTAPDTPRVGRGHAPTHHGELIQGIFTGVDGAPRPGLLTAPLAMTGASAVFVPDPSTRRVQVRTVPAHRSRAGRAAHDLLTHLERAHGRGPIAGTLHVHGRVPVGAGLGSSSADVLAALRAVVDAVGPRPSREVLCRLAVAVEGACDPLAHLPRPVLFAQRSGEVIEDLGASLPPMTVLSCGSRGRDSVDTLGVPLPDPALAATYDRLRRRARRAITTGDCTALGALATTSAELNQERLFRRDLPVLIHAAHAFGAVGVQVAHSGTVAGILFGGHAHERSATGRELISRVHDCAAHLARREVPVRGSFPLLSQGGR